VNGGFLLVRSAGRAYGLPLARVVSVDDLGEVLAVPHIVGAVRGLTPRRGRLLPLVHLAALLGNREPPVERGRAAVVVDLSGAGRLIALEVDDADEVVRDPSLPVPPGESFPLASAVVRRAGALVPILDCARLEGRLP
jgi:chemotaxis signal transduction protein